MSTLKSWLSGLLIIQVVLALGLFWSASDMPNEQALQSLVSVDQSRLSRVVISDGQNTTTLLNSDGQWRLPEAGNLPVDSEKLGSLLDKVNGLKTGWPVATSSSSQQRFEVADDKFQRRLQLYQGDEQVAELFVGTSPGFRKVHIRKAEDDNIYAVELSSFELAVTNNDWLNKSLLSGQQIVQIKGKDYTLQKVDETWQFADGTQQDSTVNVEKAKQLVTALSDLRVESVAEQPINASSMTLEVKANNASWTYKFYQVDDKYFVSRNDTKQVFSLSKADYERITQVGLPELVVDTTQPEPPPPQQQAGETDTTNNS